MKKLSIVLMFAIALCMIFAGCAAPAAEAPATPAEAPLTVVESGPVQEAAPAQEAAPEVETAPGPVVGENQIFVYVTKVYYEGENLTIEGMEKSLTWQDEERSVEGFEEKDLGETRLIVAPDAKILFPDPDEVHSFEVAADLFAQEFDECDYMGDGILFDITLTNGTVTNMEFFYLP